MVNRNRPNRGFCRRYVHYIPSPRIHHFSTLTYHSPFTIYHLPICWRVNQIEQFFLHSAELWRRFERDIADRERRHVHLVKNTRGTRREDVDGVSQVDGFAYV